MTRLIDADALKEYLIELADDEDNIESGASWSRAFELFVEILDDEPTIEAEPVRHGKWTEKAIQDCGHMDLQEAKCSECGRWLQTPYNYYFIDYVYCPNCGAKMEDSI